MVTRLDRGLGNADRLFAFPEERATPEVDNSVNKGRLFPIPKQAVRTLLSSSNLEVAPQAGLEPTTDRLRQVRRPTTPDQRSHVIGVYLATVGVAQVPIIQPGAPGAVARELSADEAIEIAGTSYSPADVQFMQDRIPHHHRALEMAALVADRTNRPELIDVAGRINASQGDEIEFMIAFDRNY